jgi:hypothetical protein
MISDLIACDLLILDELAGAQLAECASDWRFGRIERLINERLHKPNGDHFKSGSWMIWRSLATFAPSA